MERTLAAIALFVLLAGCGRTADEAAPAPDASVDVAPLVPSCDEGIFLRIADAPAQALRHGSPSSSCFTDERPCLSSVCGVPREVAACAGPRGGLPCIEIHERGGKWVDAEGRVSELVDAVLDVPRETERPASFHAVDANGVELSGAFVACSVTHSFGCH